MGIEDYALEHGTKIKSDGKKEQLVYLTRQGKKIAVVTYEVKGKTLIIHTWSTGIFGANRKEESKLFRALPENSKKHTVGEELILQTIAHTKPMGIDSSQKNTSAPNRKRAIMMLGRRHGIHFGTALPKGLKPVIRRK